MDLKSRFNYQWRLFIPLVVLLWATIAAFAIYIDHLEKESRMEAVNDYMQLINSRVINAYEHDIDLEPFMSFIKSYYDKSIYKEIRISVYNSADSTLIYSIGEPIPSHINDKETPEFAKAMVQGSGFALRRSTQIDNNPFYFFGVSTSDDNKIYVHTAMPYTTALKENLSNNKVFWYLVLTLAICVTVVAYFSTRIGRNITVLRKFAAKASDGETINLEEEFPHDELGEVGRRILKLYKDRLKAMENSEHEHKAALKAVEEKMTVTKQLTNNINHELKTPVGVIRGYIDTMIDHPDMDEATRERFMYKIQEHMNRLCSMLDDLSTITKLENSSPNSSMEMIDMYELTTNIAAELKNIHIDSMRFEYSIPKDCHVKGSYTLIYGMIMNLIRNAVFYSHGTMCKLELLGESDGQYRFAFYDDGTGVSEEHIPHLFERFYRIDKGRSRKNGGSGLGLPIVQNSVLLMGGEIEVHNRAPHGLEFVFTLNKYNESDDNQEDS